MSCSTVIADELVEFDQRLDCFLIFVHLQQLRFAQWHNDTFAGLGFEIGPNVELTIQKIVKDF